MSAFLRSLACGVLAAAAACAQAQVVVALNTVIGPSGTNAATVAGAGNAVNFTGYAQAAGATNLLAAGSTGTAAFDFNTGFGDSLDRATGSSAGAPNVWSDRKYDSSVTGPLVLDTNLDGSFGDEAPLAGFGLHGDTFITFDLAVIRSSAGLAADAGMVLTGSAGIANTTLAQTSAAILADGAPLAVFDWSGPTATFSTYSLVVPGTVRYLTFAGLSGLDADNFYAHVGFANVTLQAVPEPATSVLLAAGALGLGLARHRRRGRR